MSKLFDKISRAFSTRPQETFHVEHPPEQSQADSVEVSQRAAVVAEARSWVGTRFRWRAAIKDATGRGGGADCASMIAETYRVTGVFDPGQAEYFSPLTDQSDDTSTEVYLLRVLRHAEELTSARVGQIDWSVVGPGDMAIIKIGGSKIFWHGGIITQLAPLQLVHCIGANGCREVNPLTHPVWLGQPPRYFTPWGKKP